jgi:hypothetical protein
VNGVLALLGADQDPFVRSAWRQVAEKFRAVEDPLEPESLPKLSGQPKAVRSANMLTSPERIERGRKRTSSMGRATFLRPAASVGEIEKVRKPGEATDSVTRLPFIHAKPKLRV